MVAVRGTTKTFLNAMGEVGGGITRKCNELDMTLAHS